VSWYALYEIVAVQNAIYVVQPFAFPGRVGALLAAPVRSMKADYGEEKHLDT